MRAFLKWDIGLGGFSVIVFFFLGRLDSTFPQPVAEITLLLPCPFAGAIIGGYVAIAVKRFILRIPEENATFLVTFGWVFGFFFLRSQSQEIYNRTYDATTAVLNFNVFFTVACLVAGLSFIAEKLAPKQNK